MHDNIIKLHVMNMLVNYSVIPITIKFSRNDKTSFHWQSYVSVRVTFRVINMHVDDLLWMELEKAKNKLCSH